MEENQKSKNKMGVMPVGKLLANMAIPMVISMLVQAMYNVVDSYFVAKLSEEVINGSKAGYPELEEKKEFIFKVLTNEENQFNKTIDQGLRILGEMEDEMKAAGEKTLSGENAFKLYDTYGFPLDLTKEILEEKEAIFSSESS